MDTPKYKRVLVKISGEALAGDRHFGLNFDVIGPVCDVIKRCADIGCEVGIVVGGGNFWRGVKDGGGRMERTRADHMGMLATTINALALADALEQRGCEVRVQTAIAMNQIASPTSATRQPATCPRVALSSSAAARATPTSRPIPQQRCVRQKSVQKSFFSRRTLTAYTIPTRQRTRMQRNTTV